MSNLLNIGRQALSVNTTALNYTGENIANVNTEGYSRQRVVTNDRGGFVNGVAVNEVQRMTDQFMVKQVWKDTATLGSDAEFLNQMSFLESIVGTTENNISASLDTFFEAAQVAADDPMLTSARQVFLSSARELADKFQNIQASIDDQNGRINETIYDEVREINDYLTQVARINDEIRQLASTQVVPNQMLDARDELVRELSQHININAFENNEGIMNITLSSGEPLLTGTTPSFLSVDLSQDSSQVLDISLNRGDTKFVLNDSITGGSLAGLRSYQNDVLLPSKAEFGRLALVVGETFNEQHRKGVDLEGNAGEDLFSEPVDGNVLAFRSNVAESSSSSMNFYGVDELKATSYEVEITGQDGLGNISFQVTRASDGLVLTEADFTEFSTLPPSDPFGLAQDRVYVQDTNAVTFSLDGFTVDIVPSAIRQGDRWTVEPTMNGGVDMQVAITAPRKLAVAAMVLSRENPANIGTATISTPQITNTLDSSALRTGLATFPLSVVVNAPNLAGDDTITVYDMSSGSPVAIPALTDVVYTSGDVIAIDDYEFTIEGVFQAGDEFFIEYNNAAVGDNQNMLAMGALQSANIVDNNTLQGVYGSLVAGIGVTASSATVSYEASQSTLDVSFNALESQRGVNLDEEAANLIKYQQAYTASAQIIVAHQTIFDALLGAVGR